MSENEPSARASDTSGNQSKELTLLEIVSRVLRFALPAFVIGSGVLALALARANAPQPSQSPRAQAALVVRTMEAVAVPAPRMWEGYGVARAMVSADLSAQVSGRVAEVVEGIEEGTPVAAGDVLVRIEAIDYEQRLVSARQQVRATEAQIEEIATRRSQLQRQQELAQEEAGLAQSDVDRVRGAADRGAATQTDVDLRVTTLRRAERTLATIEEQLAVLPAQKARLEATLSDQRAAVRIAEENLARTTIATPVDGFVQRLDVEEGELLSVGSRVVRVVDIDRLEVPLRIALGAAESLAVGDPVELRADNGSGERWEGVIARIAPEAEPASRTFTVFVEVEQNSSDAIGSRSPQTAGGLLLLPGQFVVGRVNTGVGEPRIVVPRKALTGDRVLVAVNGGNVKKATMREVSVLHYFEGPLPEAHPTETQWAVLRQGDAGGIQPGESVIVSNFGQVEPGMTIDTKSVFEQDKPGGEAGQAGGPDENGGER